VRPAWITAWEANSLSVLTDGRFEMGIGTGRPGISDQLHELGLPVTPASQRSGQVREVVTALRGLDGADLHTPVVMAVGGPKAQALAAELADTVTFVMPQTETRAQTMRRVRQFDNRRDVELALHVPVIGDSVASFMAGPDTDPAAQRSLGRCRGDPTATRRIRLLLLRVRSRRRQCSRPSRRRAARTVVHPRRAASFAIYDERDCPRNGVIGPDTPSLLGGKDQQ
jgi:alkanesulfonate monooxygenase SsuD/methylene tetrahydromethanopterin reductase-like flavin-dependent oxidoreductase (luciferase family)